MKMRKNAAIALIIAAVLFSLLPVLACFAKGERELVMVLSARVRSGLKPDGPDAPPNVPLSPGTPAAQTPRDLLQYAVRVKVTDNKNKSYWYGSGVVIDRGVLTAAHVAYSGDLTIEVESDGEMFPAKLLASNKTADISLLSVNWKTTKPFVDLGTAAVGDEAKSIGRNEDGILSIKTHKVKRFTQWDLHDEVQVDPGFNQGRSGGGVIAGGKLIGIVTKSTVAPSTIGFATGIGAIKKLLASAEEKNPEETKPQEKKLRAIMWSPSWCTACRFNDKLLSAGDSRVAYEKRTGDEKAFPKEVLDYAFAKFTVGKDAGKEHGWPVWQIERPNGKWYFAYHCRSFDDIVKIRELPEGAAIPPSTLEQGGN